MDPSSKLWGRTMIVISLGSNLGNRLDNLWRAVKLIEQRCLQNVQHSIILETEAILPKHAKSDWNKPFLNMIICGTTHLSPKELFDKLKDIEREIGRAEKYERWSPRVIDLDILLYDELIVDNIDLIIPHPEIKNRPFLKNLLSLMNIKPWALTNFESPFINSYVLHPKFVGVVNITQDSFSDGGKFYEVNNAIEQMLHLDQDGASIIEIGAQSTRPGAVIHSLADEYVKLDEVLSSAAQIIDDRKLQISIDTFHPAIALKIIKKHKISLINDVKGVFDDDSLRSIANSGCKFCLMHSLTIPPSKNNVISSSVDLIEYLMAWGEQSLKRLNKLGFSKENIILDPGIGFGKNSHQNIEILKNIDRLKSLECQIMLGHSRKSYIKAFSKEVDACNRDIETIAISLAVSNKVDFLRVHNVRDHMKAMVSHFLVQGQHEIRLC